MPLTAPTLPDAMPDPPQRLTDTSDDYVEKFDNWLFAWPTFGDQVGDLAENVYMNAVIAYDSGVVAQAAAATAQAAAAAVATPSAYFGTITTSLAIGSGAKSLTGIGSITGAANTHQWSLVDRANFANRMTGILSSVNLGAGTATLTVPADGFAGSGTIASWFLIPAALLPLLTGTGADLRAAVSAIAGMTPDAIFDALETVTLTDAATITVDMATFKNAKVTLGGNRTLGAPSNTKDGKTGRIRVIGGGNSLGYASAWKPIRGVTPSMPATGYALIEYDCLDNGDVAFDLLAFP